MIAAIIGPKGLERLMPGQESETLRRGARLFNKHMQLLDPNALKQDTRGGRNLKQMASFLATDDVPETIFGIPVITREDQYTNADLQFFKEHPEAGGYYDMGEGTPEDGTEEGAPVQDDVPEWDFLKGDGRDELLPAGKFNSFGGTLRHDGRAAMLNKDKDGKVVGYGTTESMVHYNPKDKRYYVIPTISQGARVDDPVAHFAKTGGYFASAKTSTEAVALAEKVHEHHQKRYGDLWNQYIQDNWDSMSDTIKSDPGVKDTHDARMYIENLKVPTLSLGYNVVAKAEGFTPVAKPDVGGLSLGHGAHFYGAYKTEETKIKKGQTTTRLAAAQQFARDYYFREHDLAKEIPNFKLLSKESKVALVDIAFGKDGQLSKANSPSLHRRLAAAKSTAEADRIVQDEYHTYGANEGADVKGRRQLVAKALWGKTLEYRLDKASGKYKGYYK